MVFTNFRRVRIFSVVAGVLLFLSGCASTSVTAYKDPNFASKTYESLAIYANTENLEWRQSLEQTMVAEINKRGGYAVPSMSLIPPTRDYEPGEAARILFRENNIGGLITIKVGDSGVQQQWIPQTGSTTTSSGTVSTYGNTGTYSGTSSTTYQGGYNVNKPWAKMSTELIDLESGKKVWVASSHTGGNAYASFNTIRKSYCKKIANELQKAGLFISPDY